MRTFLTTRAGVIAAGLMLPLALTACGNEGGNDGGNDGAGSPADASKSDFCATYASLLKAVTDQATDGEGQAKALKEWADKLEDVGTPDGISEEARKGFELSIEQIRGLDDDATAEDLSAIEKDLSEEQKAQAEALGKYVFETCPDLLKDLMPTDLPSMG